MDTTLSLLLDDPDQHAVPRLDHGKNPRRRVGDHIADPGVVGVNEDVDGADRLARRGGEA
jgi:hypothetical protein